MPIHRRLPKRGFHNVFRVEYAVVNLDTLAERFEASGYDTAAFISAFVLDRRFGLDQGFSRYEDRFEPVAGGDGNYPERNAKAVTDVTLNWLERGRDKGGSPPALGSALKALDGSRWRSCGGRASRAPD